MCKSLFFELQHERRCAWRLAMVDFAAYSWYAAEADHSGEGDKGNCLNHSRWCVNQTQELAQYTIVEMLNGWGEMAWVVHVVSTLHAAGCLVNCWLVYVHSTQQHHRYKYRQQCPRHPVSKPLSSHFRLQKYKFPIEPPNKTRKKHFALMGKMSGAGYHFQFFKT